MTSKPLFDRRPEAVLFDMDGVLSDTMPRHFDAWRQVFQAVGIELNRTEVYLREGEAGTVSARDFLLAAGRPAGEEEVRRIVAEKEKLFKRKAEVRLFPGAEELIAELSRRELPLALVTGTSQREVERVLPPDMLGRFASVVTGDMVRQGKPHPEPYLAALDELGAEPSATVVVENAPYGIRSAKSAGAYVVAVETSLPASYLAGADLVLGSLDGVRRLLLRTTEAA
jgi:beta-phosphoglucomutase